jgi:deoxyribonuclease V
MILLTDAHYRDDDTSRVAGLLVADWSDSAPTRELALEAGPVAPYEPGSFYKRELPCLLALLSTLDAPPDCVVVDGHAWVQPGRPGLGAHLHAQTGIPVVGVAKRAFIDGGAIPVLRGESASPLYVTAAGCDPVAAAESVRGMAGPHRFPALLTWVDHLARGLPTR